MPLKSIGIARSIFSILLLFGFNCVFAQKTVTGSVINRKDNQAIGGASVTIKGSTTGTQTSDAGKFTLNVKDNSVIVVSAVGFETTEIPVAGKTDLGTVSL